MACVLAQKTVRIAAGKSEVSGVKAEHIAADNRLRFQREPLA